MQEYMVLNTRADRHEQWRPCVHNTLNNSIGNRHNSEINDKCPIGKSGRFMIKFEALTRVYFTREEDTITERATLGVKENS